jgi:SAM-dependent methyltransferase
MSLQTQHDPKNEAEITYWNSAGGRRWSNANNLRTSSWVRACKQRWSERRCGRASALSISAVVPVRARSRALGERVGPSGQVLGIDVSAPMLARAAERLPPGAPVKFVRADATTYKFESTAFDLLFSRFGVMFFAEPARAFANLRTALKPGGRLAFACWRSLASSAAPRRA